MTRSEPNCQNVMHHKKFLQVSTSVSNVDVPTLAK